MEEKDIYGILKIISDSIKGERLAWRMEGSANLKMQGVEVSVNDLDITTNNEGIKIFRKKLKKYVVKDFYSEKIKGDSLICGINGFEVEINAYNDIPNMLDKAKTADWIGMRIPVLPLENAKLFYQLIGRKEKVELIERYL